MADAAACPEWQEDLAGWLVAQLAPDREARLAAHLEGCRRCREEADALLAVAAVSLAAEGVVPAALGPDDGEPPADLGDRIAASVRRQRRHRALAAAGLALLAGAAAVVAAVALGVGGRDGAPEPLQGRTVTFAVVPAGGSAQAVVADDPGGSVVALRAEGLDPGTTYALWLTPPGGDWTDRVAAGTFRPDPDGSVSVELPCALPAEDYGRAWATTPDGAIALDTE